MKPIHHHSADKHYYDSRAECYDAFNAESIQSTNALITKLLKQHHVQTVLDLTCGTGAQVFYLLDAGFDVVGCDISTKMLEIARAKAQARQQNVKFIEGDCSTLQVGQFDAVITIFNAIGHLTREDFQRTLCNIYQNLGPKGVYVFDIFNLRYLLQPAHISRLTGDWMSELAGEKIREIQFSTITDDGILASYSTYVHQTGHQQPTQIETGYANTSQCYTAEELKLMLQQAGFSVLAQTDMQGEAFDPMNSERILTLAQKIG